MSAGSILFVHGTVVRLKAYQPTYLFVRDRAAEEGIQHAFVECEWGDALGIEMPVLSLPGELDEEQVRAARAANEEWAHLEDDPLFELRLLTIVGSGKPPQAVFGRQSAHEQLWARVEAYRPGQELQFLLARVDALELWPRTWSAIIERSPTAKRAVLASHENPADAAMALARALFAELSRQMQREGLPAPDAAFRSRLIERLRVDWGFRVFALTGPLKALFSSVLKERRRAWSERVWPEVGDILLYQANGDDIIRFIEEKVRTLESPVYLLAHSLGGIACVDLLIKSAPPNVVGLITVGTQAPLLYEIGALRTLKRRQPLPDRFPRWINLFSQNDVLSYVGEKLFPGRVTDVEIQSADLPLAAHSAYWRNDRTWSAIKEFLA